jgi:hypothetical protein
VLFPAAEVLGVTEHVAIALVGAYVYRDGVEIRLERRLRRGDLALQEWQVLQGEFMEHWYGWRQSAEERLRYGVVLSSGERALDGSASFAGDPVTPPTGPALVRTGGGGGGDGHSFAASDGLWLWPLPPEGPLELVLQWPALGIPETRTYLDGTAIRSAAGHARAFWT